MNKKTLIFSLLMLLFFSVGFIAMYKGKPSQKSERIYAMLQTEMPYVLEKRVGGFSIVSKTTGEKEKPPASEVFRRLDELEKMWGKEHLRISENMLIVLDDSGTKKTEIVFHTQEEKAWVKKFFGLE